MPISERLMLGHNLLAAMVLLQMLWLAGRWFLGIEPNRGRIPFLLLYTVVVGLAITRMPTGFKSRLKKLKELLVQNEKFLILDLCLVVLTIGIVYANYQRPAPDELHSFSASRIVAEEGPGRFFADYAQIPWVGNQHPPLVPLLYGFALHIFGVNPLVIRLASLILTIATMVLTYFLARELYNRETGLLAALLLLSLRYFPYMGAIANNDMPVTFFFTLALFFIVLLHHTPKHWLSVAAGLSIGAGLLSKYTMVLIYPVLLIDCAIYGSLKGVKLHLGLATLVSISVLAPWLVYAYHVGVFGIQKDTVASYAMVVMTTNFGKKLVFETLLAVLPSALGVYNLPMLFLGALHLMRRRSQSDLFILLWIAVVFLLLSLTLPMNRYFMPAFPALAIVMACGLSRVPDAMEQAVVLALLNCAGALYLSVDWHRAAFLFFR